jgi:hypothetical protein
LIVHVNNVNKDTMLNLLRFSLTHAAAAAVAAVAAAAAAAATRLTIQPRCPATCSKALNKASEGFAFHARFVYPMH